MIIRKIRNSNDIVPKYTLSNNHINKMQETFPLQEPCIGIKISNPHTINITTKATSGYQYTITSNRLYSIYQHNVPIHLFDQGPDNPWGIYWKTGSLYGKTIIQLMADTEYCLVSSVIGTERLPQE